MSIFDYSSKAGKFTVAATLAALVGGASFAQTAQPQAPVAADLPQVLQDLNLSGLEVDRKKRGFHEVEGVTADGLEIEAMLDPENNLVAVEAGDDAALPQSLIDAVVPEAVRSAEAFSQFSVVSDVKTRRDHFHIEGLNADGQEIEAVFNAEGEQVQFDRDDRKGKKGRHHGKKGGDDHKHGHNHDRHGERMENFDEANDITVEDAAAALANAGYSDFGPADVKGPGLAIQANNPEGEPVWVMVSPRGDVVRELAR